MKIPPPIQMLFQSRGDFGPMMGGGLFRSGGVGVTAGNVGDLCYVRWSRTYRLARGKTTRINITREVSSYDGRPKRWHWVVEGDLLPCRQLRLQSGDLTKPCALRCPPTLSYVTEKLRFKGRAALTRKWEAIKALCGLDPVSDLEERGFYLYRGNCSCTESDLGYYSQKEDDDALLALICLVAWCALDRDGQGRDAVGTIMAVP